MPVVDDEIDLLGIITVDDVVDVIAGRGDRRRAEDVRRRRRRAADQPVAFQLPQARRLADGEPRHRVLSRLRSSSLFDGHDPRATVLAIYMPIVAGMGGNACAQAMAVAIRGIAMGEVDRAILRHIIIRETLVGILTGIVIGRITAAVALLWQNNPMLGVVVALALIINHTLASITGAGIPMLMKKLGFDPAQSATIFATTVTDVVGFFSLLGLAYLFMKYLIPQG